MPPRWSYGTGRDLRPRSNPARGYWCVPTPTQRAIPSESVIEYQQKLGSKRAYHAMHYPRIRGLAVSAGVRLRAKETEISAASWALEAREGLFLLFYNSTGCCLFSYSSESILYWGLATALSTRLKIFYLCLSMHFMAPYWGYFCWWLCCVLLFKPCP